MKPIKYPFIFLTYLWLRFDPILYLAFQMNWKPRYDFMASIFGKKDAEAFLSHRVKLVKIRNRKPAPVVLPESVNRQTNIFLKLPPTSKAKRLKRKACLRQLINWALDPDINRQNIDSYQTRSRIVDALLGVIFQNAIASELPIILNGIEKIVFSRVTYLGSRGEPSPVVHDFIIAGVGRILTSHFNEQARLRQEKLDSLTKIKLIKAIKDEKTEAGSLAFSASNKKNDQFKNKYPLDDQTTHMLISILKHYRFSAWPESRQTAKNLISSMEHKLGFTLEADL